MGELRYCPQCGDNRYLTMDINWIIFVILLILGVVLGLIYLLYCYLAKQKCGVCGMKADLMEPPRTRFDQN